VTDTIEVDRAEKREREDRLLRRLRDDFLYYAPRALRIKDKAGKLIPFEMNREQRYVHERLEKQRSETGKVRAIIVKPRQRGITTYIQARFYHKTSTRRGRGAFTLSHRDDTTQAIFDMVERYYDNDALIHPHVDRANAKQLRFDRMDSNFRVGTAGGKAVGHGFTLQLFHGSEAAYWANPESHMEGVGQAIPNEPDTEVILESTGNGRGTWFHGICRDAEKGLGEYQIIFFPWFWAEDYALPLPAEGFDFSVEDLEYQDLHQISDEHLYWRRMKIDGPDFRGDVLAFQQAYPATLAEAFISREGSFIPAMAIARARKTVVEDPVGAFVLGADPTAYGNDRFAIAGRIGRKQMLKETHVGWGPIQAANRLAHILEHGVLCVDGVKRRPARVFVDKVGVGAGTVDRLHELGFTEEVVGVAGSEKTTDPERWFNKKAEMWDLMREAIEDEPHDLIDDDDLEADLTAPKYERDVAGQRLKIESKESLRKRNVRSPDNADAYSLTWAQPVSAVLAHTTETRSAPRRIQRRERPWQSR
jgi:hypothetical protein